MTQCETPCWAPLEAAVGLELASDFMWMYEVELADGRKVQAYKHIYTRRYVHLGADGDAFAYESRQHYRRIGAADAFDAVFAVLPGLFGVTQDQIDRSWAAVDRLEDAAERSES